MPQVTKSTRKERAALLRDAGKATLNRYLGSLVGTPVLVLVEHPGRGHSETFAPVRLEGAAPTGSIVEARVTRLINTADGGELMAEVTSVSGAEISPGEAAA